MNHNADDNESDTLQLLTELCRAASKNDRAQVASLLGYQLRGKKNVSSSLHAPLLPNSKIADRLVNHLLVALPADAVAVTVDLVVKALFMSPFIYETPWMTACRVVELLHRAPVSSSRSLVLDVQTFLQQAVAAWWEEDRRQVTTSQRPAPRESLPSSSTSSPRDWMVQLAQIVVRPLFLDQTPASQNKLVCTSHRHQRGSNEQQQQWLAPLQLLPISVSLAKDLDSTMFQLILDSIFSKQQPIRPDCLLPWVHLASELRLYLREERDWRMIQQTIHDILTVRPCPVDKQDLPGLAQSILSLCGTLLSKATTATTTTTNIGNKPTTTTTYQGSMIVRKLRMWQYLLRQLLWVAATSSSEAGSNNTSITCYSTIETVLLSYLSTSLSLASLQLWMQALIPPEETIKRQRDTITTAGEEDGDSDDNDNDDSLAASDSTENVPAWVEACMVLSVLRAANQSGSRLVSHLMMRALFVQTSTATSAASSSASKPKTINDKPSYFYLDQCGWQRLVQLTGISGVSASPTGHENNNRKGNQQLGSVQRLKLLFSECRYEGKGSFDSDSGDAMAMETLSKAGALVYQSLTLDKKEEQLPRSWSMLAVERAQAWVDCANRVLQHGCSLMEEMAMAVVVIITVYMEIPLSRSSLERRMLQSFVNSGQQLDHAAVGSSSPLSFQFRNFDTARLHCLIISVLLRKSVINSPNKELLGAVSEVLRKPLPLYLFQEAVDALLPLPSSRSLLLSIAQKGLNNGEFTITGTIDELGNETSSGSNALKCGLYALIALSSSSSPWGGTEEEAWLIISSVIVDRKVHLSLELRCWLLDVIRRKVNFGAFDTSAAQHLLRCCFVRLLVCLGLDKSKRQIVHHHDAALSVSYTEQFVIGSPMSTKEVAADLTGLIGLILDLVYLGVNDGNDAAEGVRDATVEAFGYYLTPLLNYDSAPTNATFSSEIVEPSENRQQQTFPAFKDDPTLPYRIAMYCLSLIFHSFVRHAAITGGTTVPLSSITALEELDNLLVRQEVRELVHHNKNIPLLHKDNNDGDASLATYLPNWLRLTTTHPIVNYQAGRNLQAADRDKLLLNNSIADLLIEFFVSPRWPWSLSLRQQENASLLHRGSKMRLLLGPIFAVKRMWREESAVISSPSPPSLSSATHHESLMAAYTALMSDLIVSITRALGDDSDDESTSSVKDMDDLFSLVVDTCEAADASCQTSDDLLLDEQQSWAWMRVLHELYQSLCSETASMYLISVLERRCCSAAIAAGIKNNVKEVGQRSIATIRTHDDIDTFIHFVRLSVLRVVSSSVSAVLRVSKVKDGGQGAAGSKFAEDEVLEILCSYCQDIRLGVEGASGGLTPDIYHCYLDCIDYMADLITYRIAKNPSLELNTSKLLRSLELAAKALEEVFLVASLNRALSFKRLLSVAAHTLPALARALVRFRIAQAGNLKVFDTFVGRHSFSIRLFSECTDVLFQLSTQPNFAWSDDLLVGDVSSDEDAMETKSSSENGGITKVEDLRALVRCNEKTWNWAMCAALKVFENDLEGILLLLQDDSLRELSHDDSKAYIRWRQTELSRYIRSLSRPLEKIPGQGTSVEEEEEVEKEQCVDSCQVYATSLSPGTKARYCATLERFVVALNRSTKKVCGMMYTSYHIEASTVSLHEALSVLTRWLSIDASGSIENTAGIRRWHHAERVLFKTLSSGVTHVSENSVLRKLPRTEQRVDELETNLRRLVQLFEEAQASTKSRRSRAVLVMDAISGSRHQDQGLYQKILTKLKVLDEQQVPAHGRGKRKFTDDLERLAKKERKRRTLRSRNSVIDKWLQIDQGTGQGEAYANDAYADLESFLVDG